MCFVFLLNQKSWFCLFFLSIDMISSTPEPLTTFLGHEEEPKVLGHTLELSREATPPYPNTMIRWACGYCDCVTCPQTQKALNNSYGVYLDPSQNSSRQLLQLSSDQNQSCQVQQDFGPSGTQQTLNTHHKKLLNRWVESLAYSQVYKHLPCSSF